MKKRWEILVRPPRYSMPIQVRIPSALSALHNFITILDPADNNEILQEIEQDGQFNGRHDDSSGVGNMDLDIFGVLAAGDVTEEERLSSSNRQDIIAEEMWQQYLEYIDE